MDAKITKERLSRMLSYDWLKIIGAAAAAIIIWVLVFTMSATRITPAQQFTVVNYFGNVSLMNTDASLALSNALRDGVFSYEVMETTTVDVPGGNEYGSTLLEARFATSEGDIIFAPNIQDESYAYEVDGEKVYDTYLQKLLRSYRHNLLELDPASSTGFFQEMESFLDKYYHGDWAHGELDKTAVEQDFRTRIEKNKDKRFKKDEEIARGVQSEIARIEKYQAALVEFYGYVESGLVEFTKITVYDYNNDNSVYTEGVYFINLCPDKGTMGGLSKYAGYYVTQTDENGEEQNILTAENMHVAFMKFADLEPSFEYENLLYVNYIIRLVQAA